MSRLTLRANSTYPHRFQWMRQDCVWSPYQPAFQTSNQRGVLTLWREKARRQQLVGCIICAHSVLASPVCLTGGGEVVIMSHSKSQYLANVLNGWRAER